jgi:hypothetical protein
MWWKWLSGSLMEKCVGGKGGENFREKKMAICWVFYFLFLFIYLFFSGWKVKGARIEQVSLPSVGMLVWFFYLNSIMGSVIFPLI